jgi:GNAT superfamily N-acetyltransferase
LIAVGAPTDTKQAVFCQRQRYDDQASHLPITIQIPMTSSGHGKNLFRRHFMRRAVARLYASVRNLTGLHLYLVSERAVLADTHDWSADGIAFGQLSLEQLRAAIHDSELDMSTDFIEGAIARGDQCFGAYAQGTLISYVWLACDWAPHEPGVIVKINEPYSYIYKVFTRTSHRGLGIWPALAAAASRCSVAQGREHVIGIIEISNFSSRKTFSKLGAKKVGFAGFLLQRKRCLTFYGRDVKRAGFRFEIEHQVAPASVAINAPHGESSLADPV